MTLNNFSMAKNFWDINETNNKFFGGGSFEIHLQNQYDLNIIANDKFTPLYNFWYTCKTDKKRLCKRLTEQLNMVDKEKFTGLRKGIMEESDGFKQSIMFFVINRCSFSGATLSGGFKISPTHEDKGTENIYYVGVFQCRLPPPLVLINFRAVRNQLTTSYQVSVLK